MAAHSSILAWRIPGTGEPGGLPSMSDSSLTLLLGCPFSLPPSYKDLGGNSTLIIWVSLVIQMVKNLPAMQETWVQSLGWEDSLEEGMATHSSILAWRIPMDRGVWRAAVHGVTKS